MMWVLAAVAAGLRELLRGRGEHVEELTLRAMASISLHPTGGPATPAATRPGRWSYRCPFGEPDHVRRLQLIAQQTAKRKPNAHPQMGGGIFRFAAAQRVFLRLFARQRLFNVSVTNVPRPATPLFLKVRGARHVSGGVTGG